MRGIDSTRNRRAASYGLFRSSSSSQRGDSVHGWRGDAGDSGTLCDSIPIAPAAGAKPAISSARPFGGEPGARRTDDRHYCWRAAASCAVLISSRTPETAFREVHGTSPAGRLVSGRPSDGEKRAGRRFDSGDHGNTAGLPARKRVSAGRIEVS